MLPAAGFLDLALAAGIDALASVEFRRRLVIPADGLDVQLVLDHAGELTLYAEDADRWSGVATGRAAQRDTPTASGTVPDPAHS